MSPAAIAGAVEGKTVAITGGTGSFKEIPADYAIDNCSQRTVSFILSTAKRHAQWAGIRTP